MYVSYLYIPLVYSEITSVDSYRRPKVLYMRKYVYRISDFQKTTFEDFLKPIEIFTVNFWYKERLY